MGFILTNNAYAVNLRLFHTGSNNDIYHYQNGYTTSSYSGSGLSFFNSTSSFYMSQIVLRTYKVGTSTDVILGVFNSASGSGNYAVQNLIGTSLPTLVSSTVSSSVSFLFNPGVYIQAGSRYWILPIVNDLGVQTRTNRDCFSGSYGTDFWGYITYSVTGTYAYGPSTCAGSSPGDDTMPFWIYDDGFEYDKLSFIYPPPVSGIEMNDFMNWVLDWNNIPVGNYTMGVRYGLTSTTYLWEDESSFNPVISAYPMIISKSQGFDGLAVYSQAYLKNSLGEEIYYTPILETIISSEYEPYYGTTTTQKYGYLANPSPLSSSTLIQYSYEACHKPSSTILGLPNPYDAIAYGLCVSGQKLFVPSTVSLSWIKSSMDNGKNLFPFSIFFTLKDSLKTNLESGLTGSSELILPLPEVGSVTFLSSSTLTNVVGSSTKNIIFNAEKSILWIGLAIVILLTIL